MLIGPLTHVVVYYYKMLNLQHSHLAKVKNLHQRPITSPQEVHKWPIGVTRGVSVSIYCKKLGQICQQSIMTKFNLVRLAANM